MLEQVLDAMSQRRGRGGAAGAGAFHLEVDDAVAEAPEDDVAAVARHRVPDPRLDELLDRLDRFGVLGVKDLPPAFAIDLTAEGIGANAIMRQNGGRRFNRSCSRRVVGGKSEIDN